MSDSFPTLLVLAGSRQLGGAEKSLAALLPELVRRAHVLVFVTNAATEAEFRRLDLPNLELVPMHVGCKPWELAHNLYRLWKLARERQPAAILANAHRGSLLLALYRLLPWAPRPPLAVYVRDFDYHTLKQTLWLMRDVLFLAPTQAVFDDARYRSWGLHRHRQVVLSNAVPSLECDIEPDSEQPRTIGCCARIVPWKGIDFLIRAFALLAPRQPEARLRIHGEPVDRAYFESLQQLAADLGVAERIEFCDFARDMGAVFRQGLFFVVPSLSEVPGPETFCRIIIEAWAHERPIIAFDCGGPRWLIEDGRDGFLVEERNIEQLAARMEDLFSDPPLATRLGQAGAEKVRAQFGPAALANRLLDLLFAPQPGAEPSNPAALTTAASSSSHG